MSVKVDGMVLYDIYSDMVVWPAYHLCQVRVMNDECDVIGRERMWWICGYVDNMR